MEHGDAMLQMTSLSNRQLTALRDKINDELDERSSKARRERECKRAKEGTEIATSLDCLWLPGGEYEASLAGRQKFRDRSVSFRRNGRSLYAITKKRTYRWCGYVREWRLAGE